MSRLIKKLNCVRQPEPQPMGFMINSLSSEKARMQIIASLKADLLENAGEGLKSADGLLIDAASASEIKAVEKFCQSEGSLPVGRMVKDKALKKAVDTACDFVVFNSSAPVSLTRNDKIGRILELDINLSEGLLRTAGDLPVDAILIPLANQDPSLTVHSLMIIQRLVYMVNKPIIVSASSSISSDELQSIWDMGICGLLIEIPDEKALESLVDIHQKIEKLGPPAFRKKAKMTAILPQSRTEKAEPEEDEGEEEEDE